MPEIPDIPISSFPDAESITTADKVTGLQGNANKNFTFSSILAWFVNAVKSAFVPVNRTVNGKTLDTNITLTASDVGAQPVITASGILKGNGAGGLSAAVAGADYGTYSKPSGGIPSSDMASAVQTSLGLADSAYQLPSGGIPASDLASGVIPSVPSAYTSNPAMDGTASPGSSGAWAKGDHVHPSDTSKANETEIAYVESGTTASRAYAVGEPFCWNGLLYRAKTAISSGGTFTPVTNCERTTISKMAEYWIDVTSQFSTTSSATLKVLVNPSIRTVKLFFLDNGLSNGSTAVTIPTQYAPDTSKLVYVSSTDSYRIGIFHGRFTQTPNSFGNIYEFHSFLRYYSGNRQIAVYYPLANPAYAVTFDIEYVY